MSSRANMPLSQPSSLNSTTTPLNDGQTYTGTWELNLYEDVVIQVRADTNTTITADFSHDGSTSHSSLTFKGVANTPTFNKLIKAARYFRLIVANASGSNQTTLTTNVTYGSFGSATSPLNLRLSQTADAIVTRGVPTTVDIALGRFGGFTPLVKWGNNNDIDTASDPEDVWAAGGLMNWPATAAVVSVTSSDAADDGDPTGNGALTLTIEGLDANWAAQTETITLNGVSAVTTTNTFIRVNRAYIASVGTYHAANTGNLTGTIGGATMLFIPAGVGQTQLGRYSVPANSNLLIDDFSVFIGSTKTATVKFWQYTGADDVTDPFTGGKRILREWNTAAGSIEERLRIPLVIGEKTDIWFEVTEVAANDTAVTAAFDGVLVDVS